MTYGADTASLAITPRNMQIKVRTNANFTIDEWLNGSIVVVFTGVSCASGTTTFTTAEATPLHFTDEYDECPNSGTIQVNNATIMFGNPIEVTVNGVTKQYADCWAMDAAGNGMCM